MDKAAARAAHDLMLKRIEEGLKEEDRSNARMWRGKSDAERLAVVAALSALGDEIVRSRGFARRPEAQFPGLPRPGE
jgi:hypothetical protein